MSVAYRPPVEEFFTLVATAIGTCGLAWNDAGLTRLQLPEVDGTHTESRLRRRGAAPASVDVPGHITATVDSLTAYLAGARIDFADAVLDISSLTPFDAAIYRALRDVGSGRTTTYGVLAATIGDPDAARAVGVAMSRNPWPIIVPCHRVLAADGAMGGFSAYGGTMTKRKLLTLEGSGLEMLPLFGQ